MFALAFLYLLRSSIHANALKKNISNLVRKEPLPKQRHDGKTTTKEKSGPSYASRLSASIRMAHLSLVGGSLPKRPKQVRRVSERVDIEEAPQDVGAAQHDNDNDAPKYREIRAKQSRRSLKDIFLVYGYTLYVVAVFGGFGVCPTVATSNT
jgi:hypothetical protein